MPSQLEDLCLVVSASCCKLQYSYACPWETCSSANYALVLKLPGDSYERFEVQDLVICTPESHAIIWALLLPRPIIVMSSGLSQLRSRPTYAQLDSSTPDRLSSGSSGRRIWMDARLQFRGRLMVGFETNS